MSILTATRWKNNAAMMVDVAALGYLDGAVLDCTYGKGGFWKNLQPKDFIGCDLDAAHSPIGYSIDFRHMPFSNNQFDSVVFDPAYKLNGTPTLQLDTTYGAGVAQKWEQRYGLIYDGLDECIRVSDHYVLLKCQDEVSSGKKHWQTMDFTNHAFAFGKMRLEDRFDILSTPRPQRGRQVHTHINYSTLLVFAKRPTRGRQVKHGPQRSGTGNTQSLAAPTNPPSGD